MGRGQAEAMQVRNSGLGPSLLVCKPSYFTYKVLTLDGQFDLCLPRCTVGMIIIIVRNKICHKVLSIVPGTQ